MINTQEVARWLGKQVCDGSFNEQKPLTLADANSRLPSVPHDTAAGLRLMAGVVEQVSLTPRGGIVYDGSILGKPADAWFEREHWRSKNAITEMAGGRGSVALLHSDAGDWVLRHYKRGGLVAKISADRYLWTGAQRTRSFAEWRLLARLLALGLPVPRPIAARFVRHGPTYCADLITARLMGTRTLADVLRERSLDEEEWFVIGRVIARFHAHGVHHVDLNANNILLASESTSGSGSPTAYVLDFDRGRIRTRGAWEAQVLARLKRSLEKLQRLQSNVVFGAREWAWLAAAAQAKTPSEH